MSPSLERDALAFAVTYAPKSGANDVALEMKLSLYEPQNWPELLSASQVAQLLHIAHTTVGRWCEEGTIEGVQIGRGSRGIWRIPREAVWPLVPPSIRASWPDGPWKEQPESEL